MKKIIELIENIKTQNTKYGDFIQPPEDKKNILSMKNNIKEIYDINLDNIYLNILSITNGIDNDGTVLYASDTQKIIGYDDRFIQGIISANEDWHTESIFTEYLFFAESDLYLFVQSINSKIYSCRSRDNLKTKVFETKSAALFFENILKCSLGKSLE